VSENNKEEGLSDPLHVGKHAFIYGFGSILARSAALVLIPLYTSALKPADFGILEILFRTADIVNILIAAGVAIAIIRFYTLEDDPVAKKAVISTGLISIFGIGTIIVGTLILEAEWLTRLVCQDTELVFLVRLMLVVCLMEALCVVPLAYAQARIKSIAFVAFSLFKFILSVSLNIFFVTGLGMGVKGVMTANVIAGIVSAILVTLWTIRQTGLHFHTRLLPRLLKFSLPFIPGALFLFILNSADRFFLQRYATDAIVGLYGLGYRLGTMVSIVVQEPFGKIWAVYVFKIAKRDDYRTIYPAVFKLLTFSHAFVGLALSIYAPEVVKIVSSPDYFEACRIIPLITLSYLFWLASAYFDISFYIMGKTFYKPFLMGFGAIVVSLFYWWLIPLYDMYGAAWSTLLGFAFFAAATYLVANRIYPLKYDFFRFGMLIGLGVIVYLISTIDFGISFLFLLGLKLVLVCLFPLLLYLFKYFEEIELRWIAKFYSMAREKAMSIIAR
jgi:O-antigen/teichoic acid export membrane protein